MVHTTGTPVQLAEPRQIRGQHDAGVAPTPEMKSRHESDRRNRSCIWEADPLQFAAMPSFIFSNAEHIALQGGSPLFKPRIQWGLGQQRESHYRHAYPQSAA